MNGSILTWLTALPVVGGLLVLLLGSDATRARTLARAIAFAPWLLVFMIWRQFDANSGALQFVERHSWIPSLGAEYFLGIDGLGLLMVVLTALVMPFAIVATPKAQEERLYFALLLFLQAGLFGTFTALNFFHWFLFWELGLVPAFFLVKLWGGPERDAAAVQFFVYTMVGSVAMLVAFAGLFLASGSFDFIKLTDLARTGELTQLVGSRFPGLGLSKETWMLLLGCGVLLGFAVKVPLFPCHTWLPLTYSEAPTSTSMVLTGLMSKMGVYGLIRILIPIFPEPMRVILTPLVWLSVATIVFSAFAAMAQRDLKRIVAYSSINHLGYCLLGVFSLLDKSHASDSFNDRAAALNGVIVQLFNHGLTASALFCFVGFLEQRGGGARSLEDFGGLRKAAPVLTGLMGIALFSSLGLPGLNGFVGEFLIFKGTFALNATAACVSTLGLLITAVFLLTLIQKVFTGPATRTSAWGDLSVVERLTVSPVVAAMLLLGIYPQLLLAVSNPTVKQLLTLWAF